MRPTFLATTLVGCLLTLPVIARADNLRVWHGDYKKAVKAGDHPGARVLLSIFAKEGTERAIAPIFKTLDFLTTSEISYKAAVSALAAVDEKSGVKRIERAVKHGKSVLESIFGVDVVSARSNEADDALLIGRLKDKDAAVRRRVILALGVRRRVAVVRALIEHMVKRDKDPGVEHQQCAVILTKLLGKSLPAGADYKSWWDGTVKSDAEIKKLQSPTREKPWKGRVGKSRLNFRKEASTKSKVIVVLVPKTEFQAIGQTKSFWRILVTLDSKVIEGYVSKGYVTVDRPAMAGSPEKAGLGATTFYDVPLYGKGLVFLFDASKSMVSGGLSKGAISNLQKAIDSLPKKTKFNVIAFSNKNRLWKKELEFAKDTKKTHAKEWVAQIPFGSVTRLDLALKGAFNMKDVDHIIILTDGYPSDAYNKKIPSAKIYAQVSRLNRTTQARISCFGFKAANHDMLRRLAQSTGGRYRQISK
ncbi:MAG: VWA domain-containing protein [Planctomycetota bacterium]|nr:VWA domain-containing protein [Planctomycetota bacterium]